MQTPFFLMRYPWVNSALLILLLGQFVTGYFGFTSGAEENRWLLWLHGIGAYAVFLILLWKSSIVLDVYGRGSGLTWRRVLFAIMSVLLLAVLFSGLLWTFSGPHYLWGFSLITLHILVSLALMALLVWHIVRFRWILRLPAAVGRRAFLRFAGLGLAGFAFWRAADETAQALALPGAKRRFTGSFETSSFTGRFPAVSWIADHPAPVDIQEWRLRVGGQVARPLILTYDELIDLNSIELTVILDCTGGWYTAQSWYGVPVADLLDLADVKKGARSVTVESVSGYKRRFWLNEVRGYLLGLGLVSDAQSDTHESFSGLSHSHGFPVRLVAPGQRGVNWVKWLTRLTVNGNSKYWQLPLPLK